jgi:hypothetical protein
LRDDQLRRFARHIALPEIGRDGQEALLDATVQVHGDAADWRPSSAASIAFDYLNAGGVGRVVGVDGDTHFGKVTADSNRTPPSPASISAIHLPPRPDWWPGADGDDQALAYWRGGTAATEGMLEVVTRAGRKLTTVPRR